MGEMSKWTGGETKYEQDGNENHDQGMNGMNLG